MHQRLRHNLPTTDVPAQASVIPTRRIAPILVTTVEKDLREYFPQAVHA